MSVNCLYEVNLSMHDDITDDANVAYSKASNQAVNQLNHKQNNFQSIKMLRDKWKFDNKIGEYCDSNQNFEGNSNFVNNDSAFTNYNHLNQTADNGSNNLNTKSA